MRIPAMEEELSWFEPSSSSGTASYPANPGVMTAQQHSGAPAMQFGRPPAGHRPQYHHSGHPNAAQHALPDMTGLALGGQSAYRQPQAVATASFPAQSQYARPRQHQQMARPQTPRSQHTYFQAIINGETRYFIQGPAGMVEVDPVQHGLFSPANVSSPSPLRTPRAHYSDPSAASLRGTAIMNSARALPSLSHSQMHLKKYATDDEALFDDLDADIDWSGVMSSSPLQFPPARAQMPVRPAHKSEPPATASQNAHVRALEQQVAHLQQRATFAEGLLTRSHNAFSPTQPTFSPAQMPESSPIPNNSSAQMTHDKPVAAPSHPPSFEFDHNYRKVGRKPADPADNERNDVDEAKLKTPTSLELTWGLPTAEGNTDAKSSAFVPPIKDAENVKSVLRGGLADIFNQFFKFTAFNKVQSVCFPIMTTTDENVVVTAPTGAGKTVIFELAMIRLWQTEKEGVIVYIAPTKSLCSERVKDWQNKFSSIRQKCVELTGDTNENALGSAKTARLIVTTPEKWDSVTRNLNGGTPWYESVKLFCIDEVHLLAEARGSTLEVIVSRMKTCNPEMRFVAVSATAPNIEDVAVWLGPGNITYKRPVVKDAAGVRFPPMARVYKFGDDFRPTPLQKHVHGYPGGSKSDQAFDASLNYKLLDLIEKYASRKPVLIFCNTRKGCTTAATQLLKDYNGRCKGKAGVPPWPMPVAAKVGGFKDPSLADLAAAGIGTHHAGMEYGDRRLTESLFLQGKHISVICTTSTLAVGINLPARMVIIKNTKIWDGSQGKAVDYTDLDIMQMQGRAGRPQFDTHGVAVIMCRLEEKDKYERMAKSQTILESCLHKSLVEHINSEIATKTIKQLDDAYKWLRGTFLYVRIQKNPQHYQSVVDPLLGSGDDSDRDEDPVVAADSQAVVSPEKRLEEMVTEAIKLLKEEGLIEDFEDELSSTSYGDMLCQYAIRLPTFLSLKNLPPGTSAQNLLAQLSRASEFSELKFRSGEKQVYSGFNKREDIRWPLEKISDSSDKVNILIQLRLAGLSSWDIKVPGSNPGGEIVQILQHSTRIASCITDLATYKKDCIMSKSALELSRSLNAQSWDHGASTLCQLRDLGIKGAEALMAHGIKSFADIRSSKVTMLDAALGNLRNKKQNLAKSLFEQVALLPVFTITFEGVREEVKASGVRVDFSLKIGLAGKHVQTTHKSGSGKRLTAAILLYTSDNEHLLAFRRLKVTRINDEGVSMSGGATLVKPSTKFICEITCEEFAGLGVSATLAPQTPAFKYPIPFVTRDKKEEAVVGDVSEDEKDSGDTVQQYFVKKPVTTARAPVPSIDAAEDYRLSNGNYKCRHACVGDCRHACCANGLKRKPKDPRMEGQAKKAELSDTEDERLDRPKKSRKTKFAAKRNAKQVAASMKGIEDLTATNVRLKRLPRSPKPPKTGDSTDEDIFPWMHEAEAEAESDDALPAVHDVLAKYRSTVTQKRPGSVSTAQDSERPSKQAKQTHWAAKSPQRPGNKGTLLAHERDELEKAEADLIRRPLSPRKFVNTVTASSSPSPQKQQLQVKNEAKPKQPLFRPPSEEEKKSHAMRSHTPHDSSSDSEMDELDDSDTGDTAKWMLKHVEVTE